MFGRLTHWTRPTSTVNLLRKLQLIPMWMDRCFRKPCNNSSLAGLTIGPLRDLETPAAASKILPLEVWSGDWVGRNRD